MHTTKANYAISKLALRTIDEQMDTSVPLKCFIDNANPINVLEDVFGREIVDDEYLISFNYFKIYFVYKN